MGIANLGTNLGEFAINTVVRAGTDWFIVNGHKNLVSNLTDDQLNSLLAVYKDFYKKNLETALADAKDALVCGMTDVAEQTFRATMIIAGTQAAKHWLDLQND